MLVFLLQRPGKMFGSVTRSLHDRDFNLSLSKV